MDFADFTEPSGPIQSPVVTTSRRPGGMGFMPAGRPARRRRPKPKSQTLKGFVCKARPRGT